MKYIIIVLLFFIGCSNNNTLDDKIILPDIVTYYMTDLDTDIPCNVSLFPNIQASDEGLFIPCLPMNNSTDTSLYLLSLDAEELPCCNKSLNGFITKGNGPNEVNNIHSTSKNIEDKSIYIIDKENAKIIFSSDEEITEHYFSSSDFMTMDRRSIVIEDKIISTVFNFDGDDKIFGIFNLDGKLLNKVVNSRIPRGFEPAARNLVSAICPVPNGFAYTLSGDRTIHFMNIDGEKIKTLKLGVDDELSEPYKIDNPFDSPVSFSYINRMEYNNGKLWVLKEAVIWVIDYKSGNVLKRIKFLEHPNQDVANINEFSLNKDFIFIKCNYDKIYNFKLNTLKL